MAVRQAAENLFAEHGETTILDVKNWLQQRGFDVVQQRISVWMEDLCHEQNWEFTFNGEYRIYRIRRDVDRDVMRIVFSAN